MSASIVTLKDKDNNTVYPQTKADAVYVDGETTVEDKLSEYGYDAETSDYLEACVDSNDRFLYGVKKNGDFEFGKGVPGQVQTEINRVEEEFRDTFYDEENPEYIQVDLDKNMKMLEGTKYDGKKIFPGGMEVFGEIETDGCTYNGTEIPGWLDIKIDKDNRIIEGTDSLGQKHISKFDEYTENVIRSLSQSPALAVGSFDIPLLDENFTSPVPVEVVGEKGDSDAKYIFSLPLNNESFNVRFRFRITENVVNSGKQAVVAKLGGVNIVTVKGIPLTQATTTATYNDETKTNYWPCLVGGMSINGSNVNDPFNRLNYNTGLIAFCIKYTGSENNATVENTGSSFILKIGSTTYSFPYSTYESVSALYEALKAITDIEVDYRGFEQRNSTELAVFSESKIKSVMYTGITGSKTAPIVEYTDAAEFMVPYAVNNTWHTVEAVKINGVVYVACDGRMSTAIVSYESTCSLELGGNCGVLFKDMHVSVDSPYDAEVVDGVLISSMHPYLIIYEGHGIDKRPSVEETTESNMNTTIDRLQYVFSMLSQKGYVPVSIYDIADYYEGNKQLPKRCYTLAFDDFRFDNVLDIDNRSVFTRFGVKPALDIIANRIGVETINHNGETITGEEAVMISKMHGFDVISHINHTSLNAIKPSEMISTLVQDNYTGELKGVDGTILVFPYGNTEPYLFWAMNWVGLRLGINVWPGNFNLINNRMRSKYNLMRYEIGMREDINTIITGIK